ncbi:MAG: O-methyltransferase [Polyangiales bacterium]
MSNSIPHAFTRNEKNHLTPDVLAYVQKTHVTHDAGLQRAFDTPSREGIPSIMVGPADGKLLALLLRMISAEKVVEIGTLAGYSTIHMARSLPSSGHVFTIEADPKHAELARQNFVSAKVESRVTLIEGSAAEVLAMIENEGPFDAVFIDADKGNYDVYGRWAAAHVRVGGLLLGDNALYFGKLTQEGDPAAAAMRRFHEEAREHFDTTCVLTPEGLLLGVRR